MIRNRFAVFATALAIAVGVSARPALAQTWTFNDVSEGTATPFSQTKGGITANFSTAFGPAASFFTTYSSFTTTLTGMLINVDGGSPDLGIGFSQQVTGINFWWALNSNDANTALTLSTFLGGSLVTTNQYFGSVGSVYQFVEGFTSYSGSAFDAVVISSDATDLAIGDLSVSTVPEPSTYALMAAGLAALGFVSRRRRRALVA